MSSSLPLGELLDLLRGEGFAIGVDDHLRVGKLLALEVAWNEDRLRCAVRSVIAKNARESATFDAVWRRLFAARQPVASPPALAPAAPARWLRRPPVRRLFVGFLVGLAAGVVPVAMVARWLQPAGGTHVPDAGTASEASNSVAPEAPAEKESATGALTPAGIITTGSARMPLQDHPDRESVEPPATWHSYLNLGGLLVGGGLFIGGLAIGRARSWRRKRFIPGPWRYTLRVPEATRPALDPDDVIDGAAHLTWQVAQEASGDLDVDRSVQATVASGGAPVIAYRPPPLAPRYLILEDTEGGSERWRFLYDELVRGLAREGVDIARYTFTGDPSSCTSSDGREDHQLRDLVEHCDGLILIGDGDAAFDPIEGRPAPWLKTLHHVPVRLWLNPVPEARWSRGARVIARETPMVHAVARGLAALKLTSAERGKAEAPGFPWVIERAPETPTGFGALQDHLGPVGMRAIAAVAMAGAPSIAALRWLVELFRFDLTEATWLRIVALPWFRSGAWPQGLQARLVTWLHASDATFAGHVARAATVLLVGDEPSLGSAAHLRWELELVAARGRAGDQVPARAVIQKVGATALHREVSRQLPGAILERADWRARVITFLGAVLCVLTGLRLALSDRVPAVQLENAPPNDLPIVATAGDTGDIEVQYMVKPPDPSNPKIKDDAPQIEATVIGAPNLTADKFLLVDKSVKRNVSG